MSCSFTEKISSLIDGELGTNEAREVERHVLNCAECDELRTDFLNLRSQIAGFETSLQPAVQNRALKKILSRGERMPARRLQWSWGTPAIAFATLLIVGAIIGLVLYQSSNKSEQTIAVTQDPPTAPSATPEKSSQPAPQESPKETEQPTPNKDELNKEKDANTPRRANPPTPAKKPLQREPKPGEQFATLVGPDIPEVIPERIKPADAETLTASHFERSETLLRSFRNVRLNTRDTAAELVDERKRARQLVYQNMILRREADTSGDVHIASLLESLEPILLDIANLPDKPDRNAVRVIRERVERKNIVALLQVNSAVLARALD